MRPRGFRWIEQEARKRGMTMHQRNHVAFIVQCRVRLRPVVCGSHERQKCGQDLESRLTDCLRDRATSAFSAPWPDEQDCERIKKRPLDLGFGLRNCSWGCH